MPQHKPLPWQGKQWQQLQDQLTQDQLPHALLLTGPRHTGKEQFGRALTHLLLCEAPAGGYGCGHCHPCELLAAGSHGDLCSLQPEEKSRVIKIDQVRYALEFTARTAAFGKRKVVLIQPAEGLNQNAANALLKNLEEPPAHTHLILVCHRLQGLPATIKSRCQQLRFPPPGEVASRDWLAGLIADQSAADIALAAAGDLPMLALQLHREGSAGQLTDRFKTLEAVRTGLMPSGTAAEVLDSVDLQENLTLLSSYLQRWVRREAQNHSRRGAVRRALQLLDELQQLQGAINSGANPNPGLLLETALSRVHLELAGSGEH